MQTPALVHQTPDYFIWGATSRMLNEMVKHEQMPKFYGASIPKHTIFRRSLLITFIASLLLVLFFDNWQRIAALTTTFILVACIALPIAHARFTQQKDVLTVKFLPFSQLFSSIVFLCLSYLLLLAGIKDVIVAFVLHLILFVAYSYNSQHKSFKRVLKHFQSSMGYFCLSICHNMLSVHQIRHDNALYGLLFQCLYYCNAMPVLFFGDSKII